MSGPRKKKLGPLLGQYQSVITPSLSLASALKKHYPNISDPIVIPNYLDLNKIKLKSKVSDGSTIECLNVGSLERIKDQATIIKKWKELPSKFTLDIIGDGPLKAQLEKLINENNLAKSISIIPALQKEELLSTYHQYDIAVSASIIETFGMSLLESIGAGIPVVTNCDTGPSTFINSANGKIVNTDSLINAILEVGENLAKYRPQFLRESVVKFDKSYVLKVYQQFYTDMLT